MKKFLRFAVLFVMIPAFIFTSCSDDDDDVIKERQADVEFQLLKDHLVASNLDLTNILDGWITTASAIKDDLASYFVIDIRSADAYAAGHIPGAVNSTLGNIITTATDAGDKTIIVVCYSGQGAGHGTVALRLSGYPTAKVLKWGMSGWTSTLDSWSGATGNIGTESPNWIAAPGAVAEQTTEFDDPDITETGTGAVILAARVQALLTAGFQGVTGSGVLASPGDYYINNFWDVTDVEHYGHISGAYRIKPLALASGEYMKLDPSKDVVTYCWTGQTSSMITAYLYVIGYESHSLKNGSNSMIYDVLESHKWAAISTDLPLE